MATNYGGEFHTFSEVPNFGAGCVPDLNLPLGLDGPPVSDCSRQVFKDTGIVPGATLTVAPLPVGTHLFECLIHPWMRATYTVIA